MANNITIDARLDAFFDASVDNLKDDHYVEHGSVCDICRADDMADPPEIIEHASSITRTGVVQTKTCPLPHIFHKLCLYAWMHAKLHRNENATCPMCRNTLIVCSPGPWRESCLEQAEAEAEAFARRRTEFTEWRQSFLEEAEAEAEAFARRRAEQTARLALINEQNEAAANEVMARIDEIRARLRM